MSESHADSIELGLGRDDELRREAMVLSESCRRQGYSCSESTIRALSSLFAFPVSEDLLRSTSAFSGGAVDDGRCGVLEASLAMAANMLDSPSGEKCLAWSRKLHERFESELGSFQCRDLFYPRMAEHERAGLPEAEFHCVFQSGIAAMVTLLDEIDRSRFGN